MNQWITQAYLKSFTPINNNVDVSDVAPHIDSAQLIYTREKLGKLLYDYLDVQIKNNTLTSREQELVDIAKEAIAYRAAEIAIPFLSIKIRNKGAMRMRDEFAEPASIEEMKYLRSELSNRAEYFEKRMLDFLCEYSTDFPLWLKSQDAGGNKQQIYPNITNPFQDEIYIDDKEYWDRKRNRYFYGPNGEYPNRGY